MSFFHSIIIDVKLKSSIAWAQSLNILQQNFPPLHVEEIGVCIKATEQSIMGSTGWREVKLVFKELNISSFRCRLDKSFSATSFYTV